MIRRRRALLKVVLPRIFCPAIGGWIVKVKSMFLLCCFSLLMGLWLAPEAFSAPAVTIAPSSDSVYVLQGNDFSGASGIDVTIRYDAAALANPRVVQGGLVGGALMAVNHSTPGMVRLALVRVTAINGSGTIATVTFDRMKSTGADILALTSTAISSSGSTIGIASQIVNSVKTADTQAPPSGSGSAPDTRPNSSAPAAATASSAPMGVVGLVVPLQGDSASGGKAETPSPDQATADAVKPAGTADALLETAKAMPPENPVSPAPEPEKKKIMLYKSVLERFKEFSGNKTPEALIALFSPQKGQARQDPPVVLSDGKTTMKVLVDVNPAGENNNFLLDGVSLVSLTNKDKNSWVAELLPDKKITGATISIPRSNQWEVMPLTVAPPMDVKIDRSSDRLSEADFKMFLKEHGTAKAPKFDLNNDGRRDYIDDFIFTANYLVQRDGHAKQGAKVQK
jgi:hypothetical protein